MTAMHREPVADRLGVPTRKLPADWRSRGGGGKPPPTGGGKKRGGCLPPPALLAVFLAVVVLYALTRSTS